MQKPVSLRTTLLILAIIMAMSLSGCGNTSATTPAPAPAPAPAKLDLKLLHPPSPSTVATATGPLGVFSLSEIGPGEIVDVNFVESKKSTAGWVIIDARSAAEYEKGHIPGAINFGGNGLVTILKSPMDGRVHSADKFAKLMSENGISNSTELIVYGSANDYHVYIEASPLYYGAKSWHYLNGGYEGWVKAGKKTETAAAKLPAATFTAKVVNPNMYVSTYQMADIVMNKDPKYYLIDTRSSDEYNGIGFGAVPRAGRIPGAVSYPVDITYDKANGVLAVSKFADIYKNVPKDKTIVIYCHRGCRTAFAFLALRSLGFKDVRLYEDSFVVYGAWLELPVDDEHFLNLRGDIQSTVNWVKTQQSNSSPAATQKPAEPAQKPVEPAPKPVESNKKDNS